MPVVVQGTPVAAPMANSAVADPNSEFNGRKGEKQATKCRDPFFALLFYACLITIVIYAFQKGQSVINSNQEDNNESVDYTGYIKATAVLLPIAFLGAGLGLLVLMCIPEILIKLALLFTIVISAFWMITAFVSGQILAGIFGVIFFLITLCYVRAVWSRIPFATANLVTACTAIRSNLGIAFYAYMFTAFAGVYTFTWSIVFFGVFDETNSCNAQNVCTDPNYGMLFVLFVPLFFVQQVMQNSIHVTVAGTVGHWWFEPSEASSCCSTAVNFAFIRTVTTSFGSICFGSLIVAILEALRMLASIARSQDDGNGILLCIAECIIQCVSNIMQYFNKWAFIYVGLYGYPYLEAGKNVFTLFQNRGWEAIITDDLVANTLFLVSLVVGGLLGVVGIIIAHTSNFFDEAEVQTGGHRDALAFMIGFLVGMIISSILMSTISSAVNAIIVLFAEAPAEFQQNHPELSNRMLTTWRQVYPGSI